MSKRLQVLGVPFDRLRLKEVLEQIEKAAGGQEQVFCVTPNPEICLAAQRDPKYLEVLQTAQLSIPDGFGILWAARFLKGSKNVLRWLWTLLTPWWTNARNSFPERVTGTDVFKQFCQPGQQRRIFLLGASKTVNDQLTEQLKEAGVKVVGNYSGGPSQKLEPIIRSMINAADAEVLFVAFGAPKQEFWIARNLPHLKSVKVAMGIGGAFDFLAGKRKRAPQWMRKIGLEWLFRLGLEPKRIRRIINAVVVFPWKVLTAK